MLEKKEIPKENPKSDLTAQGFVGIVETVNPNMPIESKLQRHWMKCPRCNGMLMYRELGWHCDNCGSFVSGEVGRFDTKFAYGLLCMEVEGNR